MPQRRTLPLVCRSCGAEFLAQARDAERGRAKYCSRSCGCREQAIARAAQHPQDGERNYNFRGWSSRRPSVYVARFKAKNPEKVAAHLAVAAAIRRGVLVRPVACSCCDRVIRVDAHHPDYRKPLMVVWACRRCHAQLDRIRREGHEWQQRVRHETNHARSAT